MCEHVTPASIRAAAVRIRPLARLTPVLTSADFDAAAGMRVFFKCENLQTGGAFKIRGASNLILSIPSSDLPRGVYYWTVVGEQFENGKFYEKASAIRSFTLDY